MFHSDEKLTELNFSRFNTENVDKFEGMFYGCKGLVELDLSNFKIKSGVNVKSMFNECNSLHKIYVSNLFKLENVTNSGSMFNRTLAIE
jgi:surface protein